LILAKLWQKHNNRFLKKIELPYPAPPYHKIGGGGMCNIGAKSGMFHIRSNVPPYQFDIIVKFTMWNQWNDDFKCLCSPRYHRGWQSFQPFIFRLSFLSTREPRIKLNNFHY